MESKRVKAGDGDGGAHCHLPLRFCVRSLWEGVANATPWKQFLTLSSWYYKPERVRRTDF